MTPPMVQNPGMETHIHPFEVHSIINKNSQCMYLHTSPEFHMKKLLSMHEEELDNIFNISYCFRDEPSSPIHRNQFLMLEWYRKHARYESIMDDCENLIQFVIAELKQKNVPINTNLQAIEYKRMTIQELFFEVLNIDILNYLNKADLIELIQTQFKNVPLPASECAWDDYFFLLFLNEVEPKLESYPYILLYEFPAPLAALSTLKESDPRVCERFEIYLNGIELCNCFNELTDMDEQKVRFKDQADEKLELYKYQLTPPTDFYQSLANGLPPSSGIALGLERLLQAITGIENPFFE